MILSAPCLWISSTCLVNVQVINLELSTGIPLLYIYKDKKFIKRGSPVGPTEAGVYAYTKVSTPFYLLFLGLWVVILFWLVS